MKLWCYEDTQGWGQGLLAAALRRDIDARIFFNYDEPDDGYLFFHMHHHPTVRARHKRMMEHFATNSRLKLIPDFRSSQLYDDKVAQLRAFSKWMPKTRLFRSPAVARTYIEGSDVTYPFVSKSAEGSSSYNVRLIRSIEDARNEIKQAFSDRGISQKYSQRQTGYLYWQELVEGNDHDLRVIAIGDQRLVLRRGNRDNVPFASGSGRLDHITDLDDECRSALEFSDRFFTEEKQRWCGIDLVRDSDGKWYLLETTVGWTLHGYYPCRFFPDGRMGNEVWEVVLDELEKGAFG